MSFHLLRTVRDAFNEAKKPAREALGQDLQAVCGAETEQEAKEAPRRLRERWGKIYPRVVACWEAKAYALLAFLRHPKPIRRCLYTTNQLEWVSKETKRWTKVVEVFWGKEAVEKLPYLVLSNLNERLGGRRLRDFAETWMGSYHAVQTH